MPDFNTSHVSINQERIRIINWNRTISIHLMFLLIVAKFLERVVAIKISIHLMFLLIN